MIGSFLDNLSPQFALGAVFGVSLGYLVRDYVPGGLQPPSVPEPRWLSYLLVMLVTAGISAWIYRRGHANPKEVR